MGQTERQLEANQGRAWHRDQARGIEDEPRQIKKHGDQMEKALENNCNGERERPPGRPPRRSRATTSRTARRGHGATTASKASLKMYHTGPRRASMRSQKCRG